MYLEIANGQLHVEPYEYYDRDILLEAGDWSFAMGNAHPDLKAAARYIAPSNVEHGVLKVVDRLVA